MRLKKEELFFVTSFEQASILRKYAILFLVSSVIPMVLLYYVYFRNTYIGKAVMILMALGVLVGYFSIRSLLTKAVKIAEENRKSIEPFLKPEIAKELRGKEKNELLALNHMFSAVTRQLEANIEELRQKNEELKALDLLKDDFVNNVSHELRLPLTISQESIRQVSEEMFGKVNETQARYLNLSLRNIDRLKSMIDNMLDVSKIEKGKLELYKKDADLNQLIEEVIADFSLKIEKKGLTIKSDLPAQAIRTNIDKDRITQVLVNLVGNACKFTEKGQITIAARDKGDYVECSVEDSGVGIHPKDMPYLFSKFHQIGRMKNQQEKGTGLGLVISKDLIELHDGQIRVESKEGTGTTFIFTLPKASDQGGMYL
ncbi:MAG: HAMP domain-containing histidine kinase [Candidatus Omnitrophica bacterium]|nr:HAMP domain-containing histidine kinase [Candidatus Omnitrophota bacterium]MDE2223048.1 HAMP domain-containing histidine kinase [Candidatus Omnitrophota bacterium]